MDRENLWARRSNSNKPSAPSLLSDHHDSKGDSHSRRFATSKRSQDIPTPSRNPAINGILPVNTSTTASPGAKSAFGLGSGAFASFGSALKTPKTPGNAFDFAKASPVTASPFTDSDSQGKPVPKSISSPTQITPKEHPLNTSDSRSSWPLKYTWVMWYRPPTSKNSDYEKSIRPMYKMATAQEFWRVYTHLKRPSDLPTVSDYHFFKEDIRPVWEDEENKKGGKWIMRLKKGVMDRYWDDMMLAVVGDQFAEAGEEVCGMVVSVRNGEDVLSVWTKIDGGRNVKIRETIKRILGLPSDTVIIWKSHDDSIAQRTAIDSARQDKSSSDKRRSTINENAPPSKDKLDVS